MATRPSASAVLTAGMPCTAWFWARALSYSATAAAWARAEAASRASYTAVCRAARTSSPPPAGQVNRVEAGAAFDELVAQDRGGRGTPADEDQIRADCLARLGGSGGVLRPQVHRPAVVGGLGPDAGSPHPLTSAVVSSMRSAGSHRESAGQKPTAALVVAPGHPAPEASSLQSIKEPGLREADEVRSSGRRGRVYRRCGYRDADRRQLGAGCPGLAEEGHGTWTFAVDIPSLDGRRRPVRRGGFEDAWTAEGALRRFLEGRRLGFDADPHETVAAYLTR